MNVLSFFSGALGLDLGLEKAGFTIKSMCENDPNCIKTIKANRPDIPLFGDITKIDINELPSEDIVLICGGPPCQSFSTAGKRKGMECENGNAFQSFLNIIDSIKPPYILLENVAGLLSSNKGEDIKYVVSSLETSGYKVSYKLYDTSHYGIPQQRKRVILFGSLFDPIPLIPENDERMTLYNAIHDLPENQDWIEFSPKQKEILAKIPTGGNWRSLSEDDAKQAMGGGYKNGGGNCGYFRRLAWDKPSPTLVTSPNQKSTMLAHPEEMRPLSVQEYMRIQTFPDDWKVQGSISARYRQIGNAVPVKFAEIVGKHLMNNIKLKTEDNNTSLQMHTLPTLYSKDAKGKERYWVVWVEDDTVYKQSGCMGTEKPREDKRTFTGKNIGRKNETSSHEQALFNAEKDWASQLDKGYKPHDDDDEGVERYEKIMAIKKDCGGSNHRATSKGQQNKRTKNKDDGTVEDVLINVHPILCNKWEDTPKCKKYFNFNEGVYVQPKFDGVRACIRLQDGQTVITSRTTKQYVWLNHIRDEMKIFLSRYPDVILDGELYSHQLYNDEGEEYDYRERFNIISGMCKTTRNTPHPLEGQLSYYVFDVVDPSGKLDQDVRFEILTKLFKGRDHKKTSHIKLALTKIAFSFDDVKALHKQYAQENSYEGVIIRSRDMIYPAGCGTEEMRSLYIRKYKDFIDEEVPVTGVKKDAGVADQHFVWICKYKNGETFTAKPVGKEQDRIQMYKNYTQYIGKTLNIRYQSLTKPIEKGGVPRFPEGYGFRHDITE
jgi:DNA (cytosine-5)-methyltransferase 1